MKIKPKKWGEFQHYKDINYAKGARPAWVKLHHKILDDFQFQSMPVASRALAPMLWLIASEDPAGVIDATPENLAFRLRWTGSEISEALSPLIGKGFFDVVQFPADDARPALSEVYSEPRSEERRVEKKREETPLVPLPRDGGRKAAEKTRKADAQHILEFLNGRAGKHFKPVPANLKFIEARLAEGVTVQDLKTLTVRKCREWLGTDQARYLRPETLFNATKCHSYLGDITPEEPTCSAPNAPAASAPESAPAPVGGAPPKPLQAPSPTPIEADAPGLPAILAAATRAVSATAREAKAPGTAAITSSPEVRPMENDSSPNLDETALGLVGACQKAGVRVSHIDPRVKRWAAEGITARDIELARDTFPQGPITPSMLDEALHSGARVQ